MNKFLETPTLIFAIWIYQKLKSNADKGFLFAAKQINFTNIRIKFKTEEEENFWITQQTKYYSELQNEILPNLKNFLNLKYTVEVQQGYFTQEDIYGNDITPDVGYEYNNNPETELLLIQIPANNNKFIQAFDEYIKNHSLSMLSGRMCYKITKQKEIIFELFNKISEETGNNKNFYFSITDIETINQKKKIALLEFILNYQKTGLYALEYFNLQQNKGAGYELITDLDKLTIEISKKSDTADEMAKNVKIIKQNNIISLGYCNEKIKLEPKEQNVIECLLNTQSIGREELLDFIHSDDVTSLSSCISKINKKIKNIKTKNNLPNTKTRLITSEQYKEKNSDVTGINYFFNTDFYNIEIQ